MDFYEELVQTQLTVFEGCFVLPQAPVRLGPDGKAVQLESSQKVDWEAYPDFIAIKFEDTGLKVQVVEVTRYSNPRKVRERVRERMSSEYRQKVDSWLKQKLPAIVNLRVARCFYVRAAIARKLGEEEEFKSYVDNGELAILSLDSVLEAIKARMP